MWLWTPGPDMSEASPAVRTVPASLVVPIPDAPTRRRRSVRRPPLRMMPYLIYVIGLLVVAPFAQFVVPRDPAAQELLDRLLPPFFVPGGMPQYLLGTDALGRDVFSRSIVGAQASLIVGMAGVVVGSLVGTLAGLVSGYRGGSVDEAVSALSDVQLAFPPTLLAIAVVAVLGASLPNLVVVVGLSGWMTYSRVCRSATLRLRNEEFVLAVRAVGGSDTRILFRHVLVNYLPTLIVLITLDVPRLILTEATLSFLGLGIQPPTPSWGSMVSEGRAYLETAWWIALFPAALLLLTSLSVNRIGDWLRAMLDPTVTSSRTQ